jgi:hypothetical protein
VTDYKQLPLQFPPETIEIPLSKHGKHKGKYVAIVDAVDVDLAQFNWSVNVAPHTQYAWRNAPPNTRIHATIHLHRVIMARILGRELEHREYVDHIDGDGLNNSRPNLRIATNGQNQRNRGMARHNTSGYKGVTKQGKRWRASIGVNGKNLKLGVFASKEEAYQAYCEAAEKYHGEFANTEGD